MLLLPPGSRLPPIREALPPGLFLLIFLRGRVLLGPRGREPLLLAQQVVFIPALATLAVSPRALLLTRRPLPIPLL
jgi:hypothetical protein